MLSRMLDKLILFHILSYFAMLLGLMFILYRFLKFVSCILRYSDVLINTSVWV